MSIGPVLLWMESVIGWIFLHATPPICIGPVAPLYIYNIMIIEFAIYVCVCVCVCAQHMFAIIYDL